MGRLLLVGATAVALCTTALFAANKPVTVELKDGMGKAIGTAKVSDGAGGKGVKIELDVKGLPAGQHAFHIHETGKCEGPAFTTAGGHFNPAKTHHGANNAENPKPHAGDMTNFVVSDKGAAKLTIENAQVTLGSGDNSIFTNGGTAFVIHEKADDLKSDPSGNAGNRIACGVIQVAAAAAKK